MAHQHWSIKEWNEHAKEQCIVPTVKHDGGSVTIWDCFGGTVIGEIVKIDGIIKKEQYKNILQNSAIRFVEQAARNMGPDNTGFIGKTNCKNAAVVCCCSSKIKMAT